MERFSSITTTGAPDKKKIERKKTKGEEKFDWLVYGGIGWVVNAIVSVFATDQLYNNKTPFIQTKDGPKSINGVFQSAVDKIAESKFNIFEQRWKGFTAKAVFGGTLCIGGTLVVPVIKWFEDRKGSIVRKWDQEYYGRRADTDLDIVQAHKDMDNAPRQSWFTLLGARLSVVAIAFGMGPTIGDYNSFTGKALAKVPILKYFSSFEGFGGSVSRLGGRISDWFSHSIFKSEGPRLVDSAIAKVHPLKIQASEPRALKVGEITGYELTQSGTIALLFYAISKAIAGVVHKEQQPHAQAPTARTAAILHETALSEPEKPTTKVSDVASEVRADIEKPESKRAVGI